MTLSGILYAKESDANKQNISCSYCSLLIGMRRNLPTMNVNDYEILGKKYYINIAHVFSFFLYNWLKN
jgi:hypothetical protein